MPTGQANRLMPTLRRVVLARQCAALSDGELLGAFVNARDADAFAELVRRHGPMVLGVCRRVVGDHSAADDAFQASFLVLARRAASVRPREQVGNWLYGVAYRTALKARMVLARRRAREKQVDVMPEPTATATPSATDWADLQAVIDEELAKLPDRLRVPVVLCDLEGRPQREVAKHLNVAPATLAARLASARRTLAQRLTRRGVALSGGALAGLLGLHGSASAVPPMLAAGAARVGEAVAAGASLNSLVSAHAVQLSEGVMRMMMLAKLKAVAVMAATVLVLTTGLGLGLVPAAAGDAPAPGVNPTTGARPVPAPPASFHARLAEKNRPQADPAADDATFLRRLCLDVRGDLPTPLEMLFFTADDDTDKRAKVVDWLVVDDEVKLLVAKKLGVPPERITVVRARLTNGQLVELYSTYPDKPGAFAFTPDGQYLVAGKDGHYVSPNYTPRVIVTDGKTAGLHAVWRRASDPKNTVDDHIIRLWRTSDGKALNTGERQVWDLWATHDGDKQPGKPAQWAQFFTAPVDPDAEFLKRVLTDVRGSGPTTLELKYFTEDKDPKKREKLLDTLLKDPAVQKKLGDAWKQKMLSLKAEAHLHSGQLYYFKVEDEKPQQGVPFRFEIPLEPGQLKPPMPLTPPMIKPFHVPVAPPQASKFEKLVDELIVAKKTDEAILEALTLAALGRLPTDAEKKLALPGIAGAKDRKAAWVAVAKSLAGTNVKVQDTLWFELQLGPPAKP